MQLQTSINIVIDSIAMSTFENYPDHDQKLDLQYIIHDHEKTSPQPQEVLPRLIDKSKEDPLTGEGSEDVEDSKF